MFIIYLLSSLLRIVHHFRSFNFSAFFQNRLDLFISLKKTFYLDRRRWRLLWYPILKWNTTRTIMTISRILAVAVTATILIIATTITTCVMISYNYIFHAPTFKKFKELTMILRYFSISNPLFVRAHRSSWSIDK